MKCRRVSQADIGRSMETGSAAKYNIKRVSRFVLNNRVDLAEGCRGRVAFAAKAATATSASGATRHGPRSRGV
jgi:hypothetical protein